jgi:acylphosphatase
MSVSDSIGQNRLLLVSLFSTQRKSSEKPETFLRHQMAVFLIEPGNVQNVIFRQTRMRAALARSIITGPANVRTDEIRVDIALEGDREKLQKITHGLKSGKRLNSWGACCDSVDIAPSGLVPLAHEVNTVDVKNIQYVQGFTFERPSKEFPAPPAISRYDKD